MQDDSPGGPGARSRLLWNLLALGFLDIALVTLALYWRNHHHAPTATAMTSSRRAIAGLPATKDSGSTDPGVTSFKDPCLVVRIPIAADLAPSPGLPIRECPTLQQLPPDASAEFVIVHLRQGLLEDAHSEIPLPGSPLSSFKRALLSGYTGFPLAFGIAASDSADIYLTTSDDMRHLSVDSPGSSEVLVRSPFYIPALLINKWVSDTDHPESATIKWRASPERFDLQRADGSLESYLPCEGQEFCLLTAIRDPRGNVTHITRDVQRHLSSIDAPGGASLRFTYGPAGISQISGAQGQSIAYTYDPRGYLAGAVYPDGMSTVFGWTRAGELASLSTASGLGQPPTERIHADYKHSRVISQTFSNGAVYLFQYNDHNNTPANEITSVTAPDGSKYNIYFSASGAAVQREIPQIPRPSEKKSTSSTK